MLVAAAICPHPPVLVPEAMGMAGWPAEPERDGAAVPAADRPAAWQVGAASPPGEVDAELRALRAACFAAVRELAAARPGFLAIVGAGAITRAHPPAAAGSLRRLGVPFATGAGDPVLPLSLTVGSWLASRCLPSSAPAPRWATELHEVARGATAARCLALGAELAWRAERVALLVLGDGTARRSLGVPGAPDPQAREFDERVAVALASADHAVLAGLDPVLAGQVRADGRAAWQVLAGAAAAGAALRGRLRYAGAPLDVGYLVASWTARPPGPGRAAAAALGHAPV